MLIVPTPGPVNVDSSTYRLYWRQRRHISQHPARLPSEQGAGEGAMANKAPTARGTPFPRSNRRQALPNAQAPYQPTLIYDDFTLAR